MSQSFVFYVNVFRKNVFVYDEVLLLGAFM